MMIVSLSIYQKMRLFSLGHYRIFPVYIFIYEFFFDSPIFIGLIYGHESIVISHNILYKSHLYSLWLKEILLIRHDSSSVLLVLVVQCKTDPISFIYGFRNIKYAYNSIEDVHQAIQYFQIQINAKFSVYSTQGNFYKQGVLIV